MATPHTVRAASVRRTQDGQWAVSAHCAGMAPLGAVYTTRSAALAAVFAYWSNVRAS